MKLHMRGSFAILVGLMIFTAGCIDEEKPANKPPEAEISIAGGNGPFETNTEIQFSGEGSTDEDGDTLEYWWDFDPNEDANGNGITNDDRDRVGKNVVWTYYDESVYVVRLTVSDGIDQDSVDKTITVNEPENSPVAVVDSLDGTDRGIAHPNDPFSIEFTAEESTSGDGEIIKYEWDFSYESSDGFQSEEETQTPEIEYGFVEGGVYWVYLKITNDQGETDTTGSRDAIKIYVNYNATIEGEVKDTDGDNDPEYAMPVNSWGVQKVEVTLKYNAGNSHGNDLDIWLYFPNGTACGTEEEDEGICYWENHDEENTTQIYHLKIDYWMGKFDDEEELGEWTIEIRHERSTWATEVPFELWFDIYYYED